MIKVTRLASVAAALAALLFTAGLMLGGQQSKAQDAIAAAAESPLPGVSFRFIETNGIRMRVAVAGESGPLVILVHGWPESWYSWRHQIRALADAGYRVVAPDNRGYGATETPPNVEDYRIEQLAADMVGIIDAYSEEQAIIIGHDWGALIAWNSVLLHPERFSAIAALSVPFGTARAARPSRMAAQLGDNFNYVTYLVEPSASDEEFDADPRNTLRRIYAFTSPTWPKKEPVVTDPLRAAGGWLNRLGEPIGLPPWMTEADLDYLAGQFTNHSFRAPINYYRNMDQNWENTSHLAAAKVAIPALFIAGAEDHAIGGANAEQIAAGMALAVPGLRSTVVIPGAGHWIQQEKPAETNRALLDFIRGL